MREADYALLHGWQWYQNWTRIDPVLSSIPIEILCQIVWICQRRFSVLILFASIFIWWKNHLNWMGALMKYSVLRNKNAFPVLASLLMMISLISVAKISLWTFLCRMLFNSLHDVKFLRMTISFIFSASGL